MGEMAMVERVAAAIKKARCPGREGPFGGYDYGYPDDKPVEGGRYVVRDFRDPASPDWGKWLFQTDDRDEYERVLQRMKENHIARAAIEAMRYEDGTDEDMAIAVSMRDLGVDAVRAIEIHDAWIDAALAPRND